MHNHLEATGRGSCVTRGAIAFLLILLAGLAAVTGCKRGEAEAKTNDPRSNAIAITTARVQVIPLDRSLLVVGTLVPRDEAMVAAQVEGQVTRMLVDFGARVSAGQELAFIDTDSYEAYLRQASANVARAQASLHNAEHNLKRVEELQTNRIASASEFDAATAQADQARAEVKAQEAALAIAQLNLDRSKVRAPFKGAVAERLVNLGDFVRTGTSLFRLVEDGELKFMFHVPERYSGQVKDDQLVHFEVDALPGQRIEGRVFLVSPSVNTSTRSFQAAALVKNPDRKLKANTFARGDLLLEMAVPTPTVPLEAVVSFAGVTKVFVIEGEIARLREVQTGRVHDGRQEILKGLSGGETVAVSGTTKLYEGAKTRLVKS